MSASLDPTSAVALLHEVEQRMATALENFFQRSREAIQDTLLRTIATQITPTMLAAGQTSLDWINAYPDTLSTAFAEQFRRQLDQSQTFEQQTSSQSAPLQLVDDDVLGRQLAADKIATQITESLRPELLLLFSRLQSLLKTARNDPEATRMFGPLTVIHALSRALDTLDLTPLSGTLLMQSTASPLCDTLMHTYSALDQFLKEQGIEESTTVRTLPGPTSRRTESALGEDILAHIQSVAAQSPAAQPTAAHPSATASNPSSGTHERLAILPSFIDSLAHWQSQASSAPGGIASAPSDQLLRQLQQSARQTDAGNFDLAVLDALAGLFEFILGDPDVSARYKAAIAQLQIPTLRVALESPAFFSDDHHPARQLIDLLGQFSRRFPDTHPAYADALQQVEIACAHIADSPLRPAEAFEQALHELGIWLEDENTRAEAELKSEVAHLQHIERQELGTLLALQNLTDLTARFPAPEAVLRRLEAAWIPYMASLYVAESGEGASWRDACSTLLQLFQSLQTPPPEAREARLRSIPAISSALRSGLQAQGADSTQLKNFFSAITTAQECWIRPDVSQPASVVDTFVPQPISQGEIESLARHLAPPAPDDSALQQAEQLLEGDWVDFAPPYEGLATERVAWVGVHGYLLFCDDAEEQRFSLDCTQLAAEIRAGRARIPEQSLTRKAMLRLKSHWLGSAA